MFFRLSLAPILVGGAAALILAGCVQLPQPAAPDVASQTPRPQAPSRVRQDSNPTTELRIPGQPVAQAGDIAVVPVPPIPFGQGVTERTTVPPTLPEVRPVSTVPPAASAPVSGNPMESGDLKQVIQLTNESYGRIDSYIARLTRRELVNGKKKPEELMSFLFRKQPWSVHFKWLGKEAHDREVIFVKGQYESKIHTMLAAGDSIFMPAGKLMSLAPDSPLVKSASRYPITEAGLGASIARITAIEAALERGDTKHGTLTDVGVRKRDDYVEAPLRLIEHTIPPNAETEMPRGGKRLYGFDTKSNLPVLLVCVDEKGQEVEYYRYDRVMAIKLDDADFNPEKMGMAPVRMVQNP